MNCRLLKTGHNSATHNMGVDEAVLKSVSDGSAPTTLRLYGWRPAAVSIGYFQSLKDEVDFVACKKYGVDVVRRITGGGAVYHDVELTYSFITPEDTVPKDILESYKLICSGLIEGFRELGIDAVFAPLNDIVAGGKKISGNAQTRRMNCVLQHGTIILGVDPKKMFTILKVPNEKIRDKMIAAVEERVTSVEKILGRCIIYDEAVDAFAKGFATALKLNYAEGELTDDELADAEKLSRTKYATKEWNNKR